jgi:hypothetical protein
MYVYEFGTGERPIGWSLAGTAYGTSGCSLSNLSTVFNGSSWSGSPTVYSDNRPSSIHGYDQCYFNSAQQRYYRFGGVTFPNPTTTNKIYYFDLASGLVAGRWSSATSGAAWADNPGTTTTGDVGGTVFASPDESKMLSVCSTPSRVMRMFTAATSGYQDIAGQSPFTSQTADACGCAGPRSQTADRWVTLSYDGSSGVVHEWDVNWGSPSAVPTLRSDSSHTTYLSGYASGGSMVYDAEHSAGPCYWIFGLQKHLFFEFNGSTPYTTTLLRMDASNYVITPYTLTGDLIATDSSRGSYGKHVWFPSYRVIATVQASTAPVSVFKVPT